MPPLFLVCPDCGQRFDSVPNMNRHLGMSKCLQGAQLEATYDAVMIVQNFKLRLVNTTPIPSAD